MTNEEQLHIDQSYIRIAKVYADRHSTCKKVHVGAVIIDPNNEDDPFCDAILSKGCNHGLTRNCMEQGCRRRELYGEDSKSHRLPSDCEATHSEIDAIGHAARAGYHLKGCTIYVTRYPCEACARAICASGIMRVVYAGIQPISDYTLQIFHSCNIEVIHRALLIDEDTDR